MSKKWKPMELQLEINILIQKILWDKNLSKRSFVHCWCNLVAVRAASFDDKKILDFSRRSMVCRSTLGKVEPMSEKWKPMELQL